MSIESIEISTLLVQDPEICGGLLRIDGTRMTVNQIAVWYKQGYSPEEIADQYPHLMLSQVYTALAYYHANKEEVEASLASEQEKSDQLEKAYKQIPRLV